MADEPFGQWGTVSFGIPDFLESIRDSINDFAELLTTYLEIANQALEFSKAFVKGYIDPMSVLIEAIIKEIVAFLESLKSIGLYLTGDWALLGWPPEDLRGGFQGFERRMIARLTDHSDPTRPDIPSTTKTLGFFAYVSVDPSDFERLVSFIVSFLKMFGLSFPPDTSRFPVPTIKGVKYNSQAIGVGTALQFSAIGDALWTSAGTPPQKASITWVAQPSSLKHPGNPFPVLGPSGYLVTVSTIPEGVALKYARPKANTDKKPANGNQKTQVQPREYGDVRDASGQPIKLYGGSEMLDIVGSPFEYNKGIDSATGLPKDGYCQVFGRLDPATNDVIPLEDLGPASTKMGVPGDGRGADFFLQRTFLITDGVALAQWFSGEYHAVLDLKDMPHHARWEKNTSGKMQRVDLGKAPVYYVRVWSVGKQVAEQKSIPQWDFKKPAFIAATSGQPFVVNLRSGAASLGYPSTSRKVTFVQANTQEYIKALQAALLVLVLSRADLPTLAEVEATKGTAAAEKYRAGKWAASGFATTATGLEDARGLLLRLYPNIKSMEVAGQDPVKWRSDLYSRIRALSYELYAKSGTNTRVEKIVVDATVQLRSATWGTILKVMVTAADAATAANPVDPAKTSLSQAQVALTKAQVALADADDQHLALAQAAVAQAQALADAAKANLAKARIAEAQDKTAQAQYNAWVAHLKATGRQDPTLFEGLNPDNEMGRDPEYGLAPNPFSTGMNPTDVDDLFYLDGALQSREQDFVLYDGGKLDMTFEEKDPVKALRAVNAAPEGIKRIYKMFLQADGSLLIPDEYRAYLTAKKKDKRVTSSGDLTPVFVVDRQELVALDRDSTALASPPKGSSRPGLVFTRGMLRVAYANTGAPGQVLTPLFTQAAQVLSIAASERPPGDGEWIALRLFDTWPELEDFLRAMENWTASLAEAARSMADAIVKYIAFIQAQIVELQQLIRRINALIASFLNFSFALPQFSGLMLKSDGTDGVLADLVAAKNKPSDPPLSYGGGIALVIPFAPGFVLDIIKVASATGDAPATQNINGTTTVTRPPPAIGTEAKQPAVPPPDDDPL